MGLPVFPIKKPSRRRNRLAGFAALRCRLWLLAGRCPVASTGAENMALPQGPSIKNIAYLPKDYNNLSQNLFKN
jgi:hypothetical protein